MIRRLLHTLTRREVRATTLAAGSSWDDAWILAHRRGRRPLLVRTSRAELVALASAITDSHMACCARPQTITPTTREDT